MNEPVLSVRDLTVQYRTRTGEVNALNNVSFDLATGEAIGLVGESGSGKTTLAMALLRVLADNAKIVSGQILLNGIDLVPLSENQMRKFRWSGISMVFQAAMNSLDPVYRVGEQIIEAIDTHENVSIAEARERSASLFELVGLDPALLDRYSHELSGGMRQRAVIAMALACDPAVIIADEATTALDVIVQDRILKELQRIQKDREMAMIYISHDVAVIAEVSDRIGVMYAGRLVEMGPAQQVFEAPTHPYTRGLLDSVPSVKGPKKELFALDGEPPDLMQVFEGCPFVTRCSVATSECHTTVPPKSGNGNQWCFCYNPIGQIVAESNV